MEKYQKISLFLQRINYKHFANDMSEGVHLAWEIIICIIPRAIAVW